MIRPRTNQGFALVLVLIVIVLATAIAAAFLSSTAREQRAVAAYADSSQASQLGNMVVRRVMGQISAATTENTVENPVSWASQPGMIRTYTAAGLPRNVYKLYSWDDLVTVAAGFDSTAAAEQAPANWIDAPSVFTDINQPIKAVYPVMDPAAEGEVEGFTVARGVGSPASEETPGAMPVKWLYVLQDGQMVPAAGSGRQISVAGATLENPIVGRVAFWTDDETSKINLNTASEGVFWDWPKGATPNEMLLAANPPVGNEFNRVPGHPSMTSLSSVFPELAPGQPWSNLSQFRQRLSSILSISPRVPFGQASSRGGTFPIELSNFQFGPSSGQSFGSPVPNAPLQLRTDRLFASPHELVFGWPNRTISPVLSLDMVTGREFFLTTSSRAPETTLFETPRISLWPITWAWPSAHALLANRQNPASGSTALNPDSTSIEQNQWMRAEERLLAFAATLNRARAGGGDRYYFQRQNPDSPTHDVGAIARNRQLLEYLQRLTAQTIPGFGGSFQSKYGAQTRDWILANAFNVIRSSVNQYTLQDDGRLLYSFTPIAFAQFRRWNNTVTQGYVESGAFTPAPVRLNLGSGELQTISDFPQLRETAMVFFATDRRLPVAPTLSSGLSSDERHRIQSNPYNWQNLINTNPAIAYPVGSQTTSMRAVLLLEFASRRGGSGTNQPRFWVKITGGNMSANGQSLGFDNAVAQIDLRSVGVGNTLPSFVHPLVTKNPASGAITGVKTFNPGDVTESNYGLISLPINVDPNSTEFNFSGGAFTIELYANRNGNPSLDPTSDDSLRIASYTVDFSGWNGPHGIPLAPRWNYYEIRDATPQDFPNPRFQVHDASRPTTWVATEIAPGIRTAYSRADPAINASPTTTWPINSLYPTSNVNGSITLPVNNTFFGRSTAYIFESNSGRIMTNFARRVDSIAPLSGLTQGRTAAIGSRPLNLGFEASASSGFPVITPYDTVLSVVPNPAGPGSGDPRLAQRFSFQRADNAVGNGTVLRQVLRLADYPRVNRQIHTLGSGNQQFGLTGYVTSNLYSLLGPSSAPSGMAQFGGTTKEGLLGSPGNTVGDDSVVGVHSAVPQSAVPSTGSVGDWSSQAGYLPDGGIVPRPDQDFQSIALGGVDGLTHQTPYFSFLSSVLTGIISDSTRGYFSPNRQIPSPISLLGSLPTSQTVGWQTLLFSPNPARGPSHPGLQGLRDHLLLDLFWMPVVEPYPISEEFSTAGKVNLNYRMVPFSHITRRTALDGVLKSIEITAFPISLASVYKSAAQSRSVGNNQTRFRVDVGETLNLIDTQVFASGNIFRSASQICETWLVPEGRTAQNVEQFWTDKTLTSDTAREQPYDNLYSRLTTKSNTFTVHWRAQSLRKSPGTAPGTWNEDLDRVTSEQRGSTLIERYLDPNATDVPDYATDPQAQPLGNFYKWRIVSSSLFQP